MRTTCLVVCGLLFFVESSAETFQWDATQYSQEVTPCDLAAAHGSDPDAVAPGVAQDEMDFAKAIEACEAAVAADSGNPRLRYQLARVYTYSGQAEKAEPHMEAAASADYPQALFVSGYMQFLGLYNNPKDVCKAGALLRRSAQYGRLAAQVGLARYALDGAFEDCDLRVDPREIKVFLAAAASSTSNYYQSMLIGLLQKEADARWPGDN